MNDKQRLERLRNQIDSLDERIQDLINKRARCAQDIAKIKEQSGTDNLAGGNNFYRPEREAEVLRRALERNQGPLATKILPACSVKSCPPAWRLNQR